jgi:hypothetical protein
MRTYGCTRFRDRRREEVGGWEGGWRMGRDEHQRRKDVG